MRLFFPLTYPRPMLSLGPFLRLTFSTGVQMRWSGLGFPNSPELQRRALYPSLMRDIFGLVPAVPSCVLLFCGVFGGFFFFFALLNGRCVTRLVLSQLARGQTFSQFLFLPPCGIAFELLFRPTSPFFCFIAHNSESSAEPPEIQEFSLLDLFSVKLLNALLLSLSQRTFLKVFATLKVQLSFPAVFFFVLFSFPRYLPPTELFFLSVALSFLFLSS